MRRIIVLFVAATVLSGVAAAHLCNDVFLQAKDNLAIKVDIRDGQLRIDEEGSFRVYLLNTMDRDIVDIRLEILSEEFAATVRPCEDWKRFPRLKCVRSGGKKVFFDVTLTRKDGVADGTYPIKLHLFNGRNKSMVFKTVDLGAAAHMCDLPKASIDVDGTASKEEWKDSLLVRDFTEYVRKGRYFENRPADLKAMVRLVHDDDYLGCLMNFEGGDDADADVGALYIASGPDAKPVAVRMDRISGRVACDAGADGIEMKTVDGARYVEVRIPKKLLGIEKAESVYANFTRTLEKGKKKTVAYWLGNSYSVTNPVVYARLDLRG